MAAWSQNSDVGVVMHGYRGVIIAGDGVTYNYTMTTKNFGSSTAYGVTLTDNVPEPFLVFGTPTVLSGYGSCNATGNAVRCDFGKLLLEQSVNITIPFVVPSNAATLGNIINRACVHVVSSDDNPINDCSEWANLIAIPLPDFHVTLSGPEEVIVGLGVDYFYTVTVINLGPSAGLNGLIRDQVPEPFIVSGQPVPSQGVCFPNFTDPNNINCDLGSLPFPSNIVILIPFIVLPNVRFTTVTNTIFFSTTSGFQANATFVISRPILRLVISGPIEICPGEMGYFTIEVVGVGADSASNVIVDDLLPIELVPSSENVLIWGAEAGATCLFTGQLLHCNLGEIMSNTTVSIIYTAAVPSNVQANRVGVMTLAKVSSSNLTKSIQTSFNTSISSIAEQQMELASLVIKGQTDMKVCAGSVSPSFVTFFVHNNWPDTNSHIFGLSCSVPSDLIGYGSFLIDGSPPTSSNSDSNGFFDFPLTLIRPNQTITISFAIYGHSEFFDRQVNQFVNLTHSRSATISCSISRGCSSLSIQSLNVTVRPLADLVAELMRDKSSSEIKLIDVAYLLDEWGPCASFSNCSSDLNCDGQVSSTDLKTLLSVYPVG